MAASFGEPSACATGSCESDALHDALHNVRISAGTGRVEPEVRRAPDDPPPRHHGESSSSMAWSVAGATPGLTLAARPCAIHPPAQPPGRRDVALQTVSGGFGFR